MHPGRDNRRERLVIERQPAYIGDSDLLSLVIALNTSITCRLLSLHHRLVELRITPRTIVTSRVREQIQCQPIIRVGEISRPLRKAKLDLPVGCLSVIGVQFHREQIHTDTQRRLPHLLQRLCLKTGYLRARVSERDRGYLAHIRVSGFQGSQCLVFVVWQPLVAYLITWHPWWNDRRGCDCCTLKDGVDQCRFICSIRKSLAYRRFVEWSHLVVKEEQVGLELRFSNKARHVLRDCQVLHCDIPVEIVLSCLERLECSRGVAHEEHIYFGELRLRPVPVRIGHQHHLDVVIPLFDHERAGAYPISCCVVYPVLLPIPGDDFLIQRETERGGHQIQEISCWLCECNLQGAVIECPDPAQHRGFPIDDIIRTIYDTKESLGKPPLHLRQNLSRQRIDIRLRCHRRSIREHDAWLQFKGIGFVVRGNCPGACLVRYHF